MRNGVKQFDPNAPLGPKPDFAGFADTDVSEPGRCRIPVIEITNNGTLLAFYERRWAKGDLSPHDLHLRRSADGGRTWGDVIPLTVDGRGRARPARTSQWDDQALSDAIDREEEKNYVNIVPVVDRDTGTVWVFYTWRQNEPTRLHQYFKYSNDDGVTWSQQRELPRSDGTAFDGYSGCSRGIQLSTGRLLAPFADVADGWSPVCLYSDDHGQTWTFGRKIDGNQWNCVESSLVELADGTIHLNMRNSSSALCRNVAISRDGGITWGTPVARPEFSQPQIHGNGCHSCVARLTDAKHHDRNRLLFSGVPGNRRENLTVQISYDEGTTWHVLKVIKAGPSAYSNMVVLPDMSVGCLYDAEEPGWRIRFARFTLDWLTDGKDTIRPHGKP